MEANKEIKTCGHVRLEGGGYAGNGGHLDPTELDLPAGGQIFVFEVEQLGKGVDDCDIPAGLIEQICQQAFTTAYICGFTGRVGSRKPAVEQLEPEFVRLTAGHRVILPQPGFSFEMVL